jgi:hypothetical protein
VVAILVGVLKCWTHFWKRTIQESFQQNLVEIGSVVSEEKIFFKFHHPFSILSLHKNLLFRNHWANCNQTLVEWSLVGPLPTMCPVIPTSNQDVHQAAVAAISVRGLKCRIQFCKGTTQGSFHQSFVEIG